MSAACPPRTHRMPCATCGLAPLCFPDAADGETPAVRLSRRRVRRGNVLYRRGQPFHALYAPRTGFFKTFVVLGDGRAQVLDFQMAGDLMGLDGIATGVHDCEAVALEDAEVCVVAFEDADAMCLAQQDVGRDFQREIASRALRAQVLASQLRRTGQAENRVASFLVDWSARLRRLGMPAHEFVLRMTREDIGNVLGLTLETTSRTLTRMKRRGLLEVCNRYIAIRSAAALSQLAFERGRATAH